MSDDLHLTRRGLFHFITTFIATASFAARRPLFRLLPDEGALAAEIVDDEPPPPPRVASYKRTKLEVFLKSRGIKPAHLARESGYSRQHLLRIRLGRMEPTRRCMVEVAAACARLSREHVRVSDVFDLLPVLRLIPRSGNGGALTDGGPR
jgi:hypothetical protein